LTTGGNSYFPGLISCITDDVEDDDDDDDDNNNNYSNYSNNNNILIKYKLCYFVRGIMLLSKYPITGVCKQVPCKKP